MRAAPAAIVACVALLLLFVAAPAGATRCPAWNKMSPEQKEDAVESMIERAIAGSGRRQMGLDRAAVGRCMRSQARDIEYAFDSVCSDTRTAGMQAINRTFKDHIWSCVR